LSEHRRTVIQRDCVIESVSESHQHVPGATGCIEHACARPDEPSKSFEQQVISDGPWSHDDVVVFVGNGFMVEAVSLEVLDHLRSLVLQQDVGSV
jgi:hypothetical protein